MLSQSDKEIRDAIAGHDSRNVALKRLLVDKGINCQDPRIIEFHFWSATQIDADSLAKALASQGFAILTTRKAASTAAPLPWNVEAQANQSVELTVRQDFTEGMVRLAKAHNSSYDGWGTLL